MTVPKSPDPEFPGRAPEDTGAAKLEALVRKVLASTPEKDWVRIRAVLVQSEVAGELLDLLPEMNRVMKVCPARLMGRVSRRELAAEQVDRAYTELHDSLHGVRRSLHSLLHLAGVSDLRPQGDPAPRETGGPPGPEYPALPPAANPEPAKVP